MLPKKSFLFLFITSCSLLFFCFFTSANLSPKDYLNLSTSGSGRAITGESTQHHLLNPASLIYPQNFKLGSFYLYKNTPKTNFSSWGISAIEYQSIPIAITYIQEKKTKEQYLSISTASFLTLGWSVGLSLNRWKTTKTHWNIQAGFLIKPRKAKVAVGITADYFLPLEGSFKNKRQGGIGIAYTPRKWINLYTDITYTQQNIWNFIGGIKITLHDSFIFRSGIDWNFLNKNSRTSSLLESMFFSGGIELKTKNISVAYSFKQNNKVKLYFHSIHVQLNFK